MPPAIDKLTETLRAQLAALDALQANEQVLSGAFVPLDTVIKAHVTAVLLRADSISEASRILGISRRTTHRYIAKWRLTS